MGDLMGSVFGALLDGADVELLLEERGELMPPLDQGAVRCAEIDQTGFVLVAHDIGCDEQSEPRSDTPFGGADLQEVEGGAFFGAEESGKRATQEVGLFFGVEDALASAEFEGVSGCIVEGEHLDKRAKCAAKAIVFELCREGDICAWRDPFCALVVGSKSDREGEKGGDAGGDAQCALSACHGEIEASGDGGHGHGCGEKQDKEEGTDGVDEKLAWAGVRGIDQRVVVDGVPQDAAAQEQDDGPIDAEFGAGFFGEEHHRKADEREEKVVDDGARFVFGVVVLKAADGGEDGGEERDALDDWVFPHLFGVGEAQIDRADDKGKQQKESG